MGKRWSCDEPRGIIGSWWGVAVLLGLACGACATAVLVDVLRKTTIAVESLGSVYLIDASGEQVTRVLERKQTRDGPGQWDQLYDEYFEPSFSPDGAYVACVRFRNNSHRGNPAEVRALQSSEVLIVRVSDRSERLITSVPEFARVSGVLAPVWSIDGDRIFFAVDRRVWSYSLAGARLDPVADLPSQYSGGFAKGSLSKTYLRVSRNGTRLFALLTERIGGSRFDDAVVEIDLSNGTLRPLWSGKLVTLFEIDRPLPDQIDDEAARALFGSREFPAFAPRHSNDRRFYFFARHEMGWLGRRWVAGYDRETRTEFEVRTMWRTLFWK